VSKRSRIATPSTPRSPAAPRPALERYRGAILGIAVVAILVVGAAFLFAGAAQPAYACDLRRAE
jgi:hypothetical protein